jgi:hypothetical protein
MGAITVPATDAKTDGLFAVEKGDKLNGRSYRRSAIVRYR